MAVCHVRPETDTSLKESKSFDIESFVCLYDTEISARILVTSVRLKL
jgi:hypothetical protein